MTERALLSAILNTHGARSDCRLWRANTGAARSRTGALIRFGVPGQADISGIYHDGRRIEIECKARDGRLTLDQQRWRAMIERHHGIYVLARSVEDVAQALGEAACPKITSPSRSNSDTDHG